MSQIQVSRADAAVLSFNNKAGKAVSLSIEAAPFAGKQAGDALKEVFLASAFVKAQSGKYRAAADILGQAFPKALKAAEAFGEPWTNKFTMGLLLTACVNAKPGKNGWTAKQLHGRALLAELVKLPAFADVLSAREANTVEA